MLRIFLGYRVDLLAQLLYYLVVRTNDYYDISVSAQSHKSRHFVSPLCKSRIVKMRLLFGQYALLCTGHQVSINISHVKFFISPVRHFAKIRLWPRQLFFRHSSLELRLQLRLPHHRRHKLRLLTFSSNR